MLLYAVIATPTGRRLHILRKYILADVAETECGRRYRVAEHRLVDPPTYAHGQMSMFYLADTDRRPTCERCLESVRWRMVDLNARLDLLEAHAHPGPAQTT